jgi:GT2 family glycosyltransferase
MDPLVAVVIVHWHHIEDTVECLASLRNSAYAHQLVIVVNNSSADFDAVRVSEVYPAIRIVHAEQNLGFAGGCNLGIQVALANNADYVYLLNPDTVVHANFISALLPAFADPRVGIAGPIIVHYADRSRAWIAGNRYWYWLGFPHRELSVRTTCDDHFVDFVPGAAMMIKREVFEAVGPLPDELFLYFEDLVFSLQAARAGWRTWLVGRPLVAHKISTTAGKRGQDIFTADKAYYFGRNSYLMQRPDIVGPLHALSGRVAQFLFVLPFYGAFCMINGAHHVILDYLEGLWDGVRGITGPRPKRDSAAKKAL